MARKLTCVNFHREDPMRTHRFPPYARLLLTAALGSAAAAAACRTADETRISVPPTTEVAVTRSTSVQSTRVPGGRPGGAGDPRRYGSPSSSLQSPGTVDPAGSYAFTFTDAGRAMTGT